MGVHVGVDPGIPRCRHSADNSCGVSNNKAESAGCGMRILLKVGQQLMSRLDHSVRSNLHATTMHRGAAGRGQAGPHVRRVAKLWRARLSRLAEASGQAATAAAEDAGAG